jgi:transcription elongation factor GreA
MSKEILLSRAGYEKLKRELEDLKGPVRFRIAEAIREAKSHGDLRENAAYHEAKLNQARNESRISDLERAIQTARVVDRPDVGEGVAHMGSKVHLLDLEYHDELLIALVGSFEADPSNDLISISSPLGEALIGKQVGDEVEIDAPAGVLRYRVIKVEN